MKWKIVKGGTKPANKLKDKHITGIVKLKEFKVLYNEKLYDICNPFDFENAKYVYSLPANNNYVVGTKLINNVDVDSEHIDLIKEYWATVYNNMKIIGNIVDDCFQIDYKLTNK